MKTRKLGAQGPAVSAIGLGGMYLSINDRPSDDDGVRTIHAALDAGMTFIDTADVYCKDDSDIGHNERLIARALRTPSIREGIVVGTKGGLRRPRGAWVSDATPAHLRDACEKSLKALGVDRIDLYQLHAPDPRVPFADSVGTIARLREEGKVGLVGLSNVRVDEIEAARAIVPIASVQNRWNPRSRGPETDGVLAYCTKHEIALLPYSPFGGASGAAGLSSVGSLANEAKKRGVSPHRLVLAWLLAKSPVVIPIPGARRIASAQDSAAADAITLTHGDIEAIERSFR